ncbi:MAG: hypothetical protein JSV60_05235, partial [Desulfobacterales bacterium]
MYPLLFRRNDDETRAKLLPLEPPANVLPECHDHITGKKESEIIIGSENRRCSDSLEPGAFEKLPHFSGGAP